MLVHNLETMALLFSSTCRLSGENSEDLEAGEDKVKAGSPSLHGRRGIQEKYVTKNSYFSLEQEWDITFSFHMSLIFYFLFVMVIGKCCLIQPPNSGAITRANFAKSSFALHWMAAPHGEWTLYYRVSSLRDLVYNNALGKHRKYSEEGGSFLETGVLWVKAITCEVNKSIPQWTTLSTKMQMFLGALGMFVFWENKVLLENKRERVGLVFVH